MIKELRHSQVSGTRMCYYGYTVYMVQNFTFLTIKHDLMGYHSIAPVRKRDERRNNGRDGSWCC